MSAFDAMFAAAAMPTLMDQFGESVVYKTAAGVTRTITAIVKREAFQAPMPGPMGGMTPVTLVTVADSATIGIAATELDTGTDKIRLNLRAGGNATDRPIGRIVSQGAGLITIEVK